MVKIELKPKQLLNINNGESNELLLIDLQGSIEKTGAKSLTCQEVGTVTWDGVGNPVLIIGNHKLMGKIIKLDPPLALIKRVKSEGSYYTVNSIIKRKLEFSKRPTIITSA